MLVDTLVSNVDVSLTLTLSKQAADSLERNFGLQLAMRAAVAVAVIAAYVVSIAQKNTPEQSAVALVRRVIALIVARSNLAPLSRMFAIRLRLTVVEAG